MSKTKKFVGQPILSQILKFVPAEIVRRSAIRFNANHYYKRIPVQLHLTSLLYGVLTYCNGLREMCEGLLACEGKLQHLGFVKAPARSTLSDANSNRTYRVFEDIYFQLLKKYSSFISDSRLKSLSIRNLKVIDSTTVRLFSDILRGVGRNPQNGSRKKGGFKVHAMMNAFAGVCDFIKVTAAKEHDRTFLKHLKLDPDSWIVFDKAYNSYEQFDKWTRQRVWFVTRMKENALYHVKKIIRDNSKKKKQNGVLKEQLVTMGYSDTNGEKHRFTLRRITFKAQDGKVFVFITNNLTVRAEEIAEIYKCRWMIELLFKQIKQNFPLKYFWGESENAIKIQVYCVLIAQLLMVVLRKKSQTKKSFANIITVVRLHIMSYVNLTAFIKDSFKAWRKENEVNLFSG